MDGATYTKLCEGCNLTARLDLGGNFEIGYGHNSPSIVPDAVWTQEQADDQFAIDYANAVVWAQSDLGASDWTALDLVRRAALTDMAYELGRAGLAGFPHMLLAVRQQAWETAAEACLASRYATQVPARAHRTAYMLENGTWPAGYGG